MRNPFHELIKKATMYSRLKSIEQSQDFNELKTLISELVSNTNGDKK